MCPAEGNKSATLIKILGSQEIYSFVSAEPENDSSWGPGTLSLMNILNLQREEITPLLSYLPQVRRGRCIWRWPRHTKCTPLSRSFTLRVFWDEVFSQSRVVGASLGLMPTRLTEWTYLLNSRKRYTPIQHAQSPRTKLPRNLKSGNEEKYNMTDDVGARLVARACVAR